MARGGHSFSKRKVQTIRVLFHINAIKVLHLHSHPPLTLRSSSSGGVRVHSPRYRPLVDDGGGQRASADGAADGAGRRRRLHVVLPPQDSTFSFAGKVHSFGARSVFDFRFALRHPAEVDVVVG